MQFFGEQLVIRMWETLIDKGVGGLLKPWSIKREAIAALDVRTKELLAIAQAEMDISDIRSGKKRLAQNGQLLLVKSEEVRDFLSVAKNQVRAQYGDDSNEIASLGLKKKSEHKTRRPKPAKTEA